MEPDPPKLDYAKPDTPGTPATSYAGCLLPISICVVVAGVFILYSSRLYSRSQRPEIYTSGVLITLLGVAVFAGWWLVRKRE